MGSRTLPVAEQRSSLRFILVSQVLMLCTIGLALGLTIAQGRWVPWGILLLIPAATLIGTLTLLTIRLRRLGSTGETG